MSKTINKYEVVEDGMEDYSLILREGKKVIFTSKKQGLRPLLECIAECIGRVDNASLTDKVVGGAAARLIVRSRMIRTVTAGVISQGALKCLSAHSIPVKWREETDAILRADGKGICLMEELSRRLPDDEDFFPAVFRHFSLSTPFNVPE